MTTTPVHIRGESPENHFQFHWTSFFGVPSSSVAVVALRASSILVVSIGFVKLNLSQLESLSIVIPTKKALVHKSFFVQSKDDDDQPAFRMDQVPKYNL